jgi:hypothetical protein
MANSEDPAGLSDVISDVAAAIPRSWIPRSVKAFDRLLGELVNIPIAKLRQYTARIDSQTESFKLVEKIIAEKAAMKAVSQDYIIEQAANNLTRSQYRKQKNKSLIGLMFVDEMKGDQSTNRDYSDSDFTSDLSDDWLNVFERYAEDASSERMQQL